MGMRKAHDVTQVGWVAFDAGEQPRQGAPVVATGSVE
jgi:hypothetical protein